MDVKNQKFLVLGVSKSGKSAGEYILKQGGQCFLYEELSSSEIEDAIKYLVNLGAKRVSKEEVEKVLANIDVLIISPGVPINHNVAILAKKLGVRIIGELELGYLSLTPNVVAVTGTNGKTTTVSMLENIFSNASLDNKLVGNIGIPLTSEIENVKRNTILLTEVSSFQLESVSKFCPHVACVLNVTPDHLERHYSFENYLFLKKRIFLNQKESEFAVLNFDDEIVKEFEKDIKAKVIFVSIKEKVNGAYLLNNGLYFKDEFVMPLEKLSLKGEHNVYNALFAIAVAKLYKIENSVIENSLANFKGVKHRIQLVAEIDGVKFYNDSKATNTASTMTAIDSVKEDKILILGGSEKGENYTKLFEKIKNSNVKQIVLTGAARFNMLDAASKIGLANITLTKDFDYAVKIAYMFANDGDAVLFSPACASFDNFKNYEERGERFISCVEELSWEINFLRK